MFWAIIILLDNNTLDNNITVSKAKLNQRLCQRFCLLVALYNRVQLEDKCTGIIYQNKSKVYFDWVHMQPS